MADEKTMLTFGYLKQDEIQKALNKNLIDKWSVVYTSDTKRQFLIDDKLDIIPIKSKVPVFSSKQEAIVTLNQESSTYEGEIVSILNGTRFEAYIVNRDSINSRFVVNPLSEEVDIDYDKLNNIPIINISGSITEPIDLATLSDGMYKINYFISPSTKKTISSYIGNIIFVETSNDIKTIKRFTSNKIYDYVIEGSNVSVKQYITEDFLKENNYITESDVDEKLEAFEILFNQKVEEYVNDKVRLLVIHVVSEELDNRYAKNEDITEMFI